MVGRTTADQVVAWSPGAAWAPRSASSFPSPAQRASSRTPQTADTASSRRPAMLRAL